MEGTYACNLNNRFELFLDEENDPLELLAKSEQEKRKTGDKKDTKKDAKKKGLSKTLVESVKTIAAAVDSKAPAKPLGRQNNGSPGSQQGAGGPGGNRPPRRDGAPDKRSPQASTNRNFEPRPEGDRPPRGENRGPRGDGQRGPRREFGHRDGPRGGPRGREFDRRSGDNRSGVKPVEKRGGQGQYNWGDPTDPAAQEAEAVPQENREENPEAIVDETGETVETPEAVVMSLDQWKKEMAAKKSKAEYSGNIRKPNEGEKEDPKLRKALVLKKKKAEESDDAEEDAEESEDEGEKLKKELEQTLASQFHFADQRGPPRGGRAGRGPSTRHEGGGAGGGGGSGSGPTPPRASAGPRGNNKQQYTPRVEDLNDFPSLAA